MDVLAWLGGQSTHIATWEAFLRMLFAVMVGAVVGFDRELRNKPAGQRTHILISLAAAVFTLITFELHEEVQEIGGEIKQEMHLRPPGSERTLAIAEQTLSEYGFEPYREGGETISLRNCPFHRLARQAPDLVCGLNREFIDGMLRGLGNDSVEAALLPTPGECCVKLRAKPA